VTVKVRQVAEVAHEEDAIVLRSLDASRRVEGLEGLLGNALTRS
jgi:hypothetical protein